MPAECQRMPESWHNCFSATNAHIEQKNKKVLDNHMWRDHQKETYLKCRLWIYCLSLWQPEETLNGGNSNAIIVTCKSYKPIQKRR